MADIHDLPRHIVRQLSDTRRAEILWLYKELRDQIRSQVLPPGHVITYPELMHRFRAGLEVVVYAVGLLRHDELMETRPRLGTRVVIEGETWAVPDRDKDMPFSVYVEKVMRERIADRVYPPDARIPILSILADEFGASVKTVRDGLAPLLAEGLLKTYSNKQLGTKVTRRVSRTPREKVLQLAERPSHHRGTLYRVWGESKTLGQWSRDKRCEVPYGTLKARVIQHGWPLRHALTTQCSIVPAPCKGEGGGSPQSRQPGAVRDAISTSDIEPRALQGIPDALLREIHSLSAIARTQVLQLHEELRSQIHKGELKPGRIVTYPELTSRYGAPLRAVSCAVRLLRQEGLLETKAGLGTRVAIASETWTIPDQEKLVPTALHVEKVLRRRIADRVYPPRSRIPSLKLLAEEFGTGAASVARGIAPLIKAGLLETHDASKLGTWVTALADHMPRSDLLPTEMSPVRSNGKSYSVWGETKTLPQWACDKRCVVPYSTLKHRVRKGHWPIEEALTTLPRHRGAQSGPGTAAPEGLAWAVMAVQPGGPASPPKALS
ncbi:GntR family transcriptional regulator [Streptomyces sp. NPDC003032]